MNFDSGAKVKVLGLESEEGKKLNGMEGVIDHYSRARERYAVSLPGQNELKMINETNLELLEKGATGVFSGEEEMMERLKAMGMPPEMLKSLTPEQKKQMFEMTQRQDIIERAKEAAGIDDSSSEEMKEGAGGLYSWRDASDHVYIEVKVSPEEEEKCNCEITPDGISIVIGEKKILQGNLFQKVNPKDCKSEIKDGKLSVTLAKAANMRWLMITR